jgi:hypothetical protein
MRVVVSALLHAIPAVNTIFFIMTFIYFVFAILAVDFFKGSFLSCQVRSSCRVCALSHRTRASLRVRLPLRIPTYTRFRIHALSQCTCTQSVYMHALVH